jgi:hypothetical protein
MSADYTPAPWTTDEEEHDAPYQNIKIKAGAHHTVCTVWIDDAPVRNFNSQQQANARLIAAAPDLLAALQEVAELDNVGAFPCVHAAIAKAIG